METRSVVFQVGDGLAVTFRRARLLIQEGPDEGLEYKLKDRPVVVGRGEDADLRLRDDTVSRSHAVVRPDEKGWKIHDLGSKSGTLVDGTQVELAPLKTGCRIRIGSTVLEFRVGESELRTEPFGDGEFEGLLGESDAMRRLFGLVKRVAQLDLPVLILGESGTGKEALARALHTCGPAPDGPYEIVDCTLLEREHLRSELFGHVRGAFTGADADRKGALERAHEGTVVFDEVAELPVELQPALLRCLQEGEVRPLGANRTVRVRTRVVAATNRDVRAMVAEGSFREDLFYRLSALVVEIPPLRERGDDVLLLANRFLAEGKRLTPAAVARIREYHWPGNVRELRSVMQRAGAFADGSEVGVEDLGPLKGESIGAFPGPSASSSPATLSETSLGSQVADHEEQIILDALEKAGGNRKLAAQNLGVSRATLYRKMKKLGMD